MPPLLPPQLSQRGRSDLCLNNTQEDKDYYSDDDDRGRGFKIFYYSL